MSFWRVADFLAGGETGKGNGYGRGWVPRKLGEKLGHGLDSLNARANGATERALIILNQPLGKTATFERLWNNTSMRICADGGANRLFDAFSSDVDRERFLPYQIRGDLDSLRPDVAEWYKSQGVEVVKIDDQDTTDFQKCLKLIEEIEISEKRQFEIFAFGALGGRFDQAISSINVLHVVRDSRRIILASEDSIAFLLTKGKHVILCNRAIEGPTCGLLPIGVPLANITTTGLKWNLGKGMVSSFGKLVSTSNILAETTGMGSETALGDDAIAVVEVETDADIVWTVETHL
ncbi:hypothetical protein BJ742DRAFT_835008 [Cladochytrium replicatum]|nr:hypothetical protein BJ742DRAFT_835008 [Cladochytrium replicatum]